LLVQAYPGCAGKGCKIVTAVAWCDHMSDHAPQFLLDSICYLLTC